MLVRPAEARDFPAITAIYAPFVTDTRVSFEFEVPPVEEMAERWRRLVTRGFPYLVGEVEGQVAGYAYVGPYRARAAYDWTVENSVYLASQWRGRGLGRALLLALIDAAAAADFRQMIAGIADDPDAPFAAASIGLHAACGFTPAGRQFAVGYKAGKWVDLVFMQRALGNGAESPPNRALASTL